MIAVEVNGTRREDEVESRLLLVHYLRNQLGLTGTHVGCETSNCGACTVLLNGRAIKSCTYFAVQANGKKVTTIEGVAKGDELHPLQRAFWENHGLQCGYCTPGMIMSALGFLSTNPEPTEEEVRESISGNLCRCTGYQNIVRAVMQASKEMSGAAVRVSR